MTQPDPGKETRLIPIKGRSIAVRRLNGAQLMLMAREARLIGREDIDPGRKLASVGRILDILESGVVQQADRDYLMDLTVAGDIEIEDLMPILSAFEEVPKKVGVRRGRPPKSAN